MNNSENWLTKFESCKYSNRLLTRLKMLNENMPRTGKVDIQEVQKAMFYAKKYHGEQKRQTGEPYYSHCFEVAYMLANYTSREDRRYFRTDLLVSSILHDCIEDTELSFEMIKELFGELVASQVESLTRVKIYGKITSKELVNSLLMQEDCYYKRGVLMIKMFDRLHNVQTLKGNSPKKIKRVIDETIQVFFLLSVYLEMPQITNMLIRFCNNALARQGA